MDEREVKALARALSPVVRDFVALSLTPLAERLAAAEQACAGMVDRLAALESRAAVPGPKGDAGPSGAHGPAGPQGEAGPAGADVDMAAVKALVADQIVRDMPIIMEGVAAIIPPPEAGPQGERGADGVSPSPDDIAALVAAAVAALPPAERGAPGEAGPQGEAGPAGADGLHGAEGIAGKDGRDGIDGAPGRDGVDGKDGAGIADLIRDSEGCLIATFTDGRTKNLGRVDGADGKSVDVGEVEAFILEQFAALPAPRDGVDGLGFDDLTIEHDGERTITLVFERGTDRKEFILKLPVVIHRGAWADGAYEAGDSVSWAGSTWIAERATAAKPGDDDSWRLSVKRGRDGKPGRDGKDGGA